MPGASALLNWSAFSRQNVVDMLDHSVVLASVGASVVTAVVGEHGCMTANASAKVSATIRKRDLSMAIDIYFGSKSHYSSSWSVSSSAPSKLSNAT